MLRLLLLALTLSGINISLKCQTFGDKPAKGEIIFSLAEVAPAFPGGTKAFYRFVAENLSMPDDKNSQSRAKTVTAHIVINENGKIVYGEIEKGINEMYNRSVLELIQQMPGWIPAKQNGRAVPIWVTIPIIFAE